MAGRPTKYTPEVVRIIRESLAQGDSRQLACKKAGISDDSFGRWLTDNAEFAAVVKNAEDNICFPDQEYHPDSWGKKVFH